MKHQSKCGCYYCTKIRKEKQAQIAALSVVRHEQMAQASR